MKAFCLLSIYPKNIACGVYFVDEVDKINTTKQFWDRFLMHCQWNIRTDDEDFLRSG